MKAKSNLALFIILSAACLILITAAKLNDDWLNPVRTGVGYILTPMQSGVSLFGRSLYDSVNERKTLEGLRTENEELRQTIDKLMAENTKLEAQSIELQRLRQLFELNSQYENYDTVGARIISRNSNGWFDVFRIDKGYEDGIAVDMNVLSGGGLIGIVTEVGAHYATVRSIIDDTSRVSAMAMRTGDIAIVSGDLKAYEEGRLLIGEIAIDAEIRDGDKIVTSNVSTKFLPGILIGYADGIQTDSNNLTKSGSVIPAAQFTSIQEVLVITTLKE